MPFDPRNKCSNNYESIDSIGTYVLDIRYFVKENLI